MEKIKKVILVSNFLPIRLDYNGKEWNCSWDSNRIIELYPTTNFPQGYSVNEVIYVGRVPINVPQDQQPQVIQLLLKFKCYPVFLTTEQILDYYEGYCKSTLWPVFHNVIEINNYSNTFTPTSSNLNHPDTFSSLDQQKKQWQAYSNVNKLFSEVVIEQYHTNDIVWIQDFHLLLVPCFITRKQHSANIGLFIHSPFPSSEIFRTLSSRKEILRGMLSADHIGFHLFEYARHFIACCKRILGASNRPTIGGYLGIEYGSRLVSITCCHMASDALRMDRTLEMTSVRNEIVSLRRTYQGKTILVGCDSLERLRGIPLKLVAFDHFLMRCSEKAKTSILLQVCFHDGSRIDDYHQCKEEIHHLVQLINAKHKTFTGHDVIDFKEYPSITYEERAALWRIADIMIDSCYRDGFNTMPFEYILANRASAGVLILSEFSACSKVLNGALQVNPWQFEQLVDAIRDAVYMNHKERELRKNRDLNYILANPPHKWARCVLDDIGQAKKKDSQGLYVAAGFGLDFRIMESFKKLQDKEVALSYRNSNRRIIFLDYYRTLAPDCQSASATGTCWPEASLQVLSSLEHLCKDPRNTVFIVSGCERKTILDKFGVVPGLGLVCEHGFFTRWGVMGKSARLERPWETYFTSKRKYSASWMEVVASVMQLYVDRTNGGSMEIKETSVLFRYANADPEFGRLQALELKEHLENVLNGWPLSVLDGKDYVEVRPEGLHKGVIVKKIVHMLQQKGNPIDFVLCVGDDTADEHMFEALKKMKDETFSPAGFFTCTVGQKASQACYYLDYQKEVEDLLNCLKVLSTMANRNYSSSDIRSLVSTQRPLKSSSLPRVHYAMGLAHSKAPKRNSLLPVPEEDFHVEIPERMLEPSSQSTSRPVQWFGTCITFYLVYKMRVYRGVLGQSKQISVVVAAMAFALYKFCYRNRLKDSSKKTR